LVITRIPVTTEVRERLKQIAIKGETYDAVLRRLIEVAGARVLYKRERRILETEEFVPLDEA